MSMHFAPQWVKPIKPTGSSATTPNTTEISPSALNPHPTKATPAQPTVPFPALSSSNQPSPVLSTAQGNAPMSYSRATHTPASPSFPTDGSYFPTDNNGASPNPHPFRYSRDQILGLFDEDKLKSTPIELVELLEQGSVLVAQHVNRPVGMRDLTDAEKKILSTAVHPVMPRRPQQQAPSTPSADQNSNGPTRRSGPASVTRDPTQPNGRGFGNFGRGEGGILAAGGIKSGVIGGGAVASPGDGKAPGVLGGGFGGVGKRMARGRNDVSDSPSGPWRSSRTASGNFEGVLGFGGTPSTPSQPPVNEGDESLQSPLETPHTAPVAGGWRERLAAKQAQKKEVEDAGQAAPPATAATPGWGNSQSKWRAAPSASEVQTSLDGPRQNLSASVVATPSATPLPDRDASVQVSTPNTTEEPPVQQSQPTEEDLNAIEWFYRDPQGQEHGPFIGSQMHEWFTCSYFTDDLPVKRASESGFHTLSELKQATGNAVRPFISPVRPRQPPPNLPMPNMMPPHMMPLADGFRNLAVHPGYPTDPRMNQVQPGPMPPFAQPFRNDAPFSPNHYGPQQGFLPNPVQSPGYPAQQWGGLQPGAGSRFNGVGGFGSPAGPGMLPGHFAQQGAFSPVIGGPIGRGPDFFSPSIGAGQVPGSIPTSPWAVQQQQQHTRQLHQMYPPQQQVHQPQYDQHQQPAHSADQQWQQQTQNQQSQGQDQQTLQPSYFPQVDEERAQAAPEQDRVEEQQSVNEETPQEISTEAPEPAAQDAEASESTDTIEEPASSGPPPSVWGAVPTASRRSSVTATPLAQTPSSPAVAKAPTPASKPASRKQSIAEPPQLAPVIATPERSSNTPKPAPWAVKDDKEVKIPSGPSLREIQEAEAKAAEARKQAIAELRANNAVPSPALPANEDMITSMSWGLPAQNSKAPQVSSPSVNSPSAPAWGSGDSAGPKKTMKQIQEEEEKRRAKLAQVKAQSQAQSASPAAGVSANTKRGYADLAATSAPPSGSGWQTVGAAKTVPGAAVSTPAARPAAPVKSAVVAPAKPATPVPAARSKANGGFSDDSTPSVEFVRWAKQSLNGLTVNIDEFIQMLLSFPVDPPQSERAGQLEIISDSVYANSSTLDGRRFAQEFYTRRKADSKRSGPIPNGSAVSKPPSLADVLKTQPKPQGNDVGFKVVKAKGKKKN